MPPYWQRQTADKPLFPDLLWSRPENRQYAGKLLIIGGNVQSFASPATAFAESERAGIGVTRVILPDALSRTVSKVFEAAEFAPSTPSGSFSQRALAEFLSASTWADGVLLEGDLGRNSETAILLEKFAGKYSGSLTISSSSADYFLQTPELVLQRPETLLVLDFSQLQRLVTSAHFPQAVTSNMDLVRFVELLHRFSLQYHAFIITQHLGNTIAAVQGAISTTTGRSEQTNWAAATAAHAAVWWLQNPSKPFEAITTSLTHEAIR